MKRAMPLILTVFAAGVTFAQQSLPRGIVPINGEITIRHTPKFESRCTVKSIEKKLGDSSTIEKSGSSLQSVFEDSRGALKRSMTIDPLIITFDINEGGYGLASTEPAIHSAQKIPAEEKKLFWV
jgi:hypothetical protein